MSDLDKLMKKLKTDEPKPVATPTPVAEPTPVAPAPVKAKAEVIAPTLPPAPAVLDDDDNDQEEVETPTPVAEPTPAPEENPIEHEVALLQNDGVFRRELIFVLKELVDIHKVNTQTLLDIKNKLTA